MEALCAIRDIVKCNPSVLGHVGLHELRESTFDDLNTPYVENFLRQTLVRGVGALATLVAVDNEKTSTRSGLW